MKGHLYFALPSLHLPLVKSVSCASHISITLGISSGVAIRVKFNLIDDCVTQCSTTI